MNSYASIVPCIANGASLVFEPAIGREFFIEKILGKQVKVAIEHDGMPAALNDSSGGFPLPNQTKLIITNNSGQRDNLGFIYALNSLRTYKNQTEIKQNYTEINIIKNLNMTFELSLFAARVEALLSIFIPFMGIIL